MPEKIESCYLTDDGKIDMDGIDFVIQFYGEKIDERIIKRARKSKKAYITFMKNYYPQAEYNFHYFNYEMMMKYGDV